MNKWAATKLLYVNQLAIWLKVLSKANDIMIFVGGVPAWHDKIQFDGYDDWSSLK